MSLGRILPLIAMFAVGVVVGRWGLAPRAEPVVEVLDRDGERKVVSALKPAGRVASRGSLEGLMEAEADNSAVALANRFDQLAGLGVGELEDVLAEIALASDEDLKGRRRGLQNAVVMRLLQFGPEVAWVALSKMRPGDTEETHEGRIDEWVEKVFSRLAKDDLEAGMRLAGEAGYQQAEAIQSLLDDAETDDFLKLVSWVKSVDPDFDRYGDAMTNFAPREDGRSPHYEKNQIFSRWAQADPEAAEAYVLGLDGRDQRLQGVSGVAEGLALTDPDAAVAFIQGLEKSEERGAAWHRAIEIMAGSHPADLARLYHELPDGKAKTVAIRAISAGWIQSDRAAAMAWLESLPPGGVRDRAYESAVNAMHGSESPEAAIALIDQISGLGKRTAMLHGIANGWISRDVSGAIGWIEVHDNAVFRAELIEEALPRYASENPQAAAAFYDRLEAEGSLEGLAEMASSVARNMEERDPDFALQWAERLQDPAAREAATSSVLWQIGYDDPQRARALVESGVVDGIPFDGVAQHLILEDPAAGFEWAGRWLSDEEFFSATERALSTFTWRSPEEASGHLMAAADYLEPETWQRLNEKAGKITEAWGQHDMQAALAWTESLPEGNVKLSAAMPLLDQWLSSDPMAASEWIAALRPGELQHQGAVKLSQAIQDDDPESAFLWSQGLGEGYRMDLMGDSLRTWARIEPEAARAALGAADVTPEERARLMRWLED